ncbi:hypothetical protein IHQ56_06705 [Methylobacillus flagellatus]|uniref:hypothetical protein n=1 Tax=Methylobacillus flagellatus TaxID=405 RepID=UPI002853D919|nr:hypothetical protein [Methylobacillus flagellatus]MDR5171502.1 hypothetical protein [Methylobacillus flagellatus]
MDEMEYNQLVATDDSDKIHEVDDLVIALRAAGTPFTDDIIQSVIDESVGY